MIGSSKNCPVCFCVPGSCFFCIEHVDKFKSSTNSSTQKSSSKLKCLACDGNGDIIYKLENGDRVITCYGCEGRGFR